MLVRSIFFALMITLPAFFIACDHPNPLAPAEAIGEFPEWGLAFTEAAKVPAADNSRLSPQGPAPSNAPNQAELSGAGGTAVPAAKPKTDLAKGDAAYGKQLFSNLCARCHRGGEGGQVAMIGMVPNLRDRAWHERITDSQISSTVAHGKGKMPAFVGQLNKSEIASVVAFIRTLKK